ncbi:MAG: trigger factor [Eubacterium sp.]|nr:trigger factor [Eubacterium sp.]
MSITAEKLDGNMANLTITVPAAEFDKAMIEAYKKSKSKFSVPGFRKGKVPMNYIEKVYGEAVFYDEAANELINKYYPEEIENCDLDIVSNPEIEVSEIGKGKDFVFVAKVATKPPVKLAEYKGVEIEKVEVEVTDADVDAEIEKTRKENARKVEVTDRAAENGDEVNINFEGFVDGVAFDGGKGEDYKLVLGSHSFIDTFEDQIVGKNIGDEFDVNVTFPEEYQEASLAGKPAVFKCKLNAITAEILPDLDDDFASDVSEFETVAEYKEDVKKTLEIKKKDAAEKEKQSKVLEKLVETCEIDLPEPMIKYNQEKMLSDFEQRLAYQGLKLEQYLSITKQSREEMLEQVKPEAIKRIKTSLIVEAIANAENIEVSDEEVDKEIEKTASMYQLDVEKFKELAGEKELEAIKMDVKMNKALKLIADESKEV